ncbi:MAG: ABC transporter ATP-binding protein [Halobacteriales archaeon]|nr:ABC transporter ATP-binding protein [Halobacteriales archaeon]
MIEAEGLRKVYGDVVAVAGATFRVEPGEIFGLIGPNGAGKTTTLKLLTGLVEPTAGSATVAGYDVTDREMRRRLGYVPEESPVYEEMTAWSYLRFFASLYDVDRETADERIGAALDRLDLDVRDRPLGNTSKGMRRKVAIARSLVNDPDVLIYDEPASGLDPVTTNAIIDVIRELGAERTVVFSAHNLYHVEALCDRVAMMLDGELVTQGSLEAIREAHGGVRYRVDTSVPLEDSSAVAEGRHRSVVESMAAVDELRDAAAAAGGELLDVRTHEPSLEEIFLSVAGEGR